MNISIFETIEDVCFFVNDVLSRLPENFTPDMLRYRVFPCLLEGCQGFFVTYSKSHNEGTVSHNKGIVYHKCPCACLDKIPLNLKPSFFLNNPLPWHKGLPSKDMRFDMKLDMRLLPQKSWVTRLSVQKLSLLAWMWLVSYFAYFGKIPEIYPKDSEIFLDSQQIQSLQALKNLWIFFSLFSSPQILFVPWDSVKLLPDFESLDKEYGYVANRLVVLFMGENIISRTGVDKKDGRASVDFCEDDDKIWRLSEAFLFEEFLFWLYGRNVGLMVFSLQPLISKVKNSYRADYSRPLRTQSLSRGHRSHVMHYSENLQEKIQNPSITEVFQHRARLLEILREMLLRGQREVDKLRNIVKMLANKS